MRGRFLDWVWIILEVRIGVVENWGFLGSLGSRLEVVLFSGVF